MIKDKSPEAVRARQNRYFSEAFKKAKVKEIEKNITTVSEISREYEVAPASVYKWIYKYSQHRKKGVKQVIEMKSDTKKLQLLKEKIRDLERAVGQKQLEIDYLGKLIELGSEEVGVDIKKKYGSKPLSGFGLTEENTSIK